jgi:hypothetical protein
MFLAPIPASLMVTVDDSTRITRFRIVIEGAPVEIYAQFEMAADKVKSLTIEQGNMK